MSAARGKSDREIRIAASNTSAAAAAASTSLASKEFVTERTFDGRERDFKAWTDLKKLAVGECCFPWPGCSSLAGRGALALCAVMLPGARLSDCWEALKERGRRTGVEHRIRRSTGRSLASARDLYVKLELRAMTNICRKRG